MGFCVNFFCGFLGAFCKFERRTESPQRNPLQNSRQNPCKIHACSEKRHRKMHSAGRGARELLRANRCAGEKPHFHNVSVIRANRLKTAIRNLLVPRNAIRKQGGAVTVRKPSLSFWSACPAAARVQTTQKRHRKRKKHRKGDQGSLLIHDPRESANRFAWIGPSKLLQSHQQSLKTGWHGSASMRLADVIGGQNLHAPSHGIRNRERILSRKLPLSFLSLLFLNSLFFSLARNSLFFLSVFLFFSRDSRGSVGIKIPCFFAGFPCLFLKEQGKEGQGPFARNYFCSKDVIRGERTWAIAIRPFHANESSELKLAYFSREKRPEFRRKRDLYEPLQTAMAQVLPFLTL